MRDKTTDTLNSFIVLLLGLANMAERAARLPFPLRFLLLRILRRAEAAARRVVTGDADIFRVAPWLPSSAAAHYGNRPEDAAFLAMTFRLFALALRSIRALAARFADQAGFVIPDALIPAGHPVPAPPPPDTS